MECSEENHYQEPQKAVQNNESVATTNARRRTMVTPNTKIL